MIGVEGVEFQMYGLLIGVAVMVGTGVSAKVARREGIDANLVWDGMLWVVVAGLVGARAYHVVDYWEYYSQNFSEIVMVWRGGLGILGALVGGVIGMLGVYWWRVKRGKTGSEVSWWQLLDVVSFGVPAGQAIGRWGNYFNQELYGYPTSLPWGIVIAAENRLSGYEAVVKYHPLFLYESVLSLGLLGVMLIIYKAQVKSHKDEAHDESKRGKKVGGFESWMGKYWFVGSGRFLGMYLVGYGLVRLILESMRIESWMWGEIRVASVLAGVMVMCGGWLMSSGAVRMNDRGDK